tara:strand:+ start:674 stop:1126 length:453 start_codon:yes stop_codon:yes gene_type:complete
MNHYRVALKADQPLLVELMTELVTELSPAEGAHSVIQRLDNDVSRGIQAESTEFFIAECQGQTAGLARADILFEDPIFRMREDHRCGYVDQMYVRTGFRKRGIGRELLLQCERWFRSKGIGHCLLHASLNAVGFYAKNDYKPNRQMFKKL